MATLKLWADFSKRKNSTKRPTALDAYEKNVKLKEACSIESPVFIVESITAGTNYCQFAGHYYFIDDIVYITNTIVELHCNQDVLATHRTEIGSYNCFIERASSNFDNLINDDFLSQRQDYADLIYSDTPIPDYDTTGCYVVRVLGDNDIRGYAIPIHAIKGILQFANDWNNFPDLVSDIYQTINKALYKPMQYIVSVKWMPFQAAQFGDTQEHIYLGWHDTGVIGNAISTPALTKIGTLSIPTPYYNDFRAYNSEWTNVNLLVPGIGSFDIDALYTHDPIMFKYNVDAYTGNVTLTLGDDEGNIIGSYNGSVGVDVQIGQATANISSTLAAGATGAGAIAKLVAGGATGGAIAAASIATGVAVSTASKMQNTSINGSQGSMAAIIDRPYIRTTVKSLDSASFATNNIGRPLMQNKVINTLSGYIKCGNASVPIAGYGNDAEEINTYLNGGFYYE